jgi:hypothetical protein
MSQFIVDGYHAGCTLRYLAKIYETSLGSIRTLLIEEGAVMRKPGRPVKKEK